MDFLFFRTKRPRLPPHEIVHVGHPAFRANPYPLYARLRELGPIHRVRLMPMNELAWLVVRYDEVAMILKEERFVKNPAPVLSPEQAAAQPFFRKMYKPLQGMMIGQDPPNHTRLRGLVNLAFTPRIVEGMRDRIQTLTERLLDKVQKRGTLDLVNDYALPLPAIIITEMLGVPPADRSLFHRWTKSLLSPELVPFTVFLTVVNIWAFWRYLGKFIRQRRADLQDDLTSDLIRAEQAGDKLSEKELRLMVFFLLLAGFETTVNLISTGTLALLQNPAELEKLRRDPALIKPAVEELLRYNSPVQLSTERFAREDVRLDQVVIRRGETVYLGLSSANRDGGQFTNPDSLDITREPNKHLAFGLGPHFCLGAPLARLETQIALTTLVRRLPNLRLAVTPAELRWRPGLLRGLKRLPLRF